MYNGECKIYNMRYQKENHETCPRNTQRVSKPSGQEAVGLRIVSRLPDVIRKALSAQCAGRGSAVLHPAAPLPHPIRLLGSLISVTLFPPSHPLDLIPRFSSSQSQESPARPVVLLVSVQLRPTPKDSTAQRVASFEADNPK